MSEKFQTNIKGKTLRSSRSQMFLKTTVLKTFAITIKETSALGVFLIKLKVYGPAFLLKRDSNTGAFLRNF